MRENNTDERMHFVGNTLSSARALDTKGVIRSPGHYLSGLGAITARC